jgi:colanic acid/amylovoran biosynthesis glycosyltransferase
MRKIAIATYTMNAYSETFVKAHIDQLPGEIHVLHGGYFPTRDREGRRLVRPYLLKRGLDEAFKRVTGRSARWLSREGALTSYLRRNKIDVVIAEFGQVGAQVMDSCRVAGVPLIVHFRGADAYTYGRPDYAYLKLTELYPRLMKNAAALIAVSHEIRDRLIGFGAPPENVHYDPGGADPAMFSECKPGEAPPVFVAVGRFTEKKAPHLTLLAFRDVVAAVPEARLVMAGEGRLLGPCQAIARALGITRSVEFLGPQPHARVMELMGGARGLVQHSIQASDGDSEGTPVSVMEAQLAGLPIVATRHAGIKDVVVERETGFLIDECDTDAMAEHWIQLARDPDLAGRMGAAGRKRALEHFVLGPSLERLSRLIDAVIGTARREKGGAGGEIASTSAK